jgi:hypothetical protein
MENNVAIYYLNRGSSRVVVVRPFSSESIQLEELLHYVSSFNTSRGTIRPLFNCSEVEKGKTVCLFLGGIHAHNFFCRQPFPSLSHKKLRPSILYPSKIITLSQMRQYIQNTREGSPGASRSSFENSSSSSLFLEKHILSSPLKVERTRGIGRSRSMIVEVSVQGRSSHQRRGSLTFASSINALPRAGSSRRCSMGGTTLEEAPDSPPCSPRRRASRRASAF